MFVSIFNKNFEMDLYNVKLVPGGGGVLLPMSPSNKRIKTLLLHDYKIPDGYRVTDINFSINNQNVAQIEVLLDSPYSNEIQLTVAVLYEV